MSFYVTTPIYYVNAAPHLGHAYSTISADVLARHMRQRGEDVFFLTGTDEHGEPVTQAAQREGISPRELVDRNAERFEQLMPQLNVTNDFFIRTSDDRHRAKVAEIMQEVYDRGYIYPGVYEGWYCPRCADFKTESELDDQYRCPIHKIKLYREREDNYFFKLSEFQAPLEQLYDNQPDFVMPRHRYNEARSFIAQGLQDISVSRSKLEWGVSVPWDQSQVFYVWFDALLNYLTALSYARPGEDLVKRFWPPSCQIMAKDILKFHAVIWPAILMALEYQLPRHLFIHGYLLLDGQKMSKSLGNVLDPFEVMETYGTDALRYYCFRDVSFGHDGTVSTTGLETRYETELANEYGNLASRTLTLIVRYNEGVIPEVDVDQALSADFDGLTEQFSSLLEKVELTAALDLVWQRVRRLNRYIEEKAPWKLAKEPAKEQELKLTLRSAVEGLRIVTLLLHPYMPDTTQRLLNALGYPELSLENSEYGEAPGGKSVTKLPPLFPKKPT